MEMIFQLWCITIYYDCFYAFAALHILWTPVNVAHLSQMLSIGKARSKAL